MYVVYWYVKVNMVLPLMGALLVLMEEVLDSHEKDGLRPLKENRLRRKGRPMLICDSDLTTRKWPCKCVPCPSKTSPKCETVDALISRHGVVGEDAVSDRIRSSGVIPGSDTVPEFHLHFNYYFNHGFITANVNVYLDILIRQSKWNGAICSKRLESKMLEKSSSWIHWDSNSVWNSFQVWIVIFFSSRIFWSNVLATKSRRESRIDHVSLHRDIYF